MKPLSLITVDARALHVLAAHGKAPVVLRGMDESERAQLAALCDDSGKLVAAAGEKYRLAMIAHYERLKTTDEEFDEPSPVVPEWSAADGPDLKRDGDK